jgi:hypothetical protein
MFTSVEDRHNSCMGDEDVKERPVRHQISPS